MVVASSNRATGIGITLARWIISGQILAGRIDCCAGAGGTASDASYIPATSTGRTTSRSSATAYGSAATARTANTPRHSLKVADVAVDDAEECDDRGFVSGDAVEIAQGRS